MTLIIEKPVCVITPTIGKITVRKAIESVAGQTYDNVTHLIVEDGPDVGIRQSLSPLNEKIKCATLPYNVGANGFYGHRVYAAFPHLIDHDYVMFLDEDNWFEPDHIKTMVDTLEKQRYDFAYSLRNICSEDGKFLVEDNCESLGQWPIWFNSNEFHVDTSSYIFKREMLINASHLWHFGWGADRRFFSIVRNDFKNGNTLHRTLNYRTDGNSNSVKQDFFLQGNKENLLRYDGTFPWKK